MLGCALSGDSIQCHVNFLVFIAFFFFFSIIKEQMSSSVQPGESELCSA